MQWQMLPHSDRLGEYWVQNAAQKHHGRQAAGCPKFWVQTGSRRLGHNTFRARWRLQTRATAAVSAGTFKKFTRNLQGP